MIRSHACQRLAAGHLLYALMISLMLASGISAQTPGNWVSSQVLPGGALAHGEGYVYAIVGGEDGGNPTSARAFRRYLVADGVWDELAPTPAAIGPGGALVFVAEAGGSYVYALRGGVMGSGGNVGSNALWRYSIADDSWEDLAPAPAHLNPGGSLVWDGGDWLYALRGRSLEFWRYSISGGDWEILEDVPEEVRLGGALAFAHGHVYAFVGNFNSTFLRYSPVDDEWEAVATAPGSVARGGSLAFDGDDLIYALRGNGGRGLWAYSISGDDWATLSLAPESVGGGALVHDGQNALFALRGDGHSAFWRYDIDTDAWQSDLPTAAPLASTPEEVFRGGSLVHAGGGNLFALRGDGRDDFWRYSVASNAWTALEPAPWNVTFGGGLTTDGADFLYAFRGDSDLFARYSISEDAWFELADAPESVGPGAALAFIQGAAGSHVYALRGGVTGASGDGGYDDFWRYDVAADQWEVLEAAPGQVGPGGALAWDGGDRIFALRGNRRTDFWVYSINQDSWSSLADVPTDVRFGGALTIMAGLVHAFSGNYSNSFWRYDPALDSWQSLPRAPAEVAAGAALTNDGVDLIYALSGAESDVFSRYRVRFDAPALDGPSGLGDGAVGFLYPTQQFQASGPGPITLQVQSGQLPPGMALGADGVYSGTPTQAGDYQFTIAAISPYGSSELHYSHRITAAPVAPVFAGPLNLPRAILNFGYEPVSASPVQLQAVGTVPINWWVSSGSLPAGMSLSQSGELQGVPSEDGEFNFTVTAANIAGVMNIERTLLVEGVSVDGLEIEAGDGGQIWGNDSDNAQDPFNTWYEVSRSQTIILASELLDAGIQPGPISGFSLRPSELPGRPTLANFRIFLQLTDAQTVPGTWVTEGWTQVYGPTSIPASSLEVDEWLELNFSQSFFWDGVSNLFVDLSRYDVDYERDGGMYVRTGLSNRTQAAREDGISWPSYPGDSFTVWNHIPEMRVLQLSVVPAILAPLGLPEIMAGSLLAPVSFTASGSPDIEWSVTAGALPPGLDLSASGEYSGTPTKAGIYTFTVTASNAFGSQSHEFTHEILERIDAVFEDRFELP